MRNGEFFPTRGIGEVLGNFVTAFKGQEYFILEKKYFILPAFSL